MHIKLIAVGTKMPQWVEQAFQQYQKRLPSDYQLTLCEINAAKRTKSANVDQLITMEQTAIEKAIPENSLTIALDRLGRKINTHEIAHSLLNWHDQGQNICIIIGGPEGLNKSWLNRAHDNWSLSELTLPHPMVRIIIGEQIYRAWSILSNHPYHR
ncbi:MAG: 23S rRNA (pseudouridine(1915)-N(3))-methyltransferase RlmH [Gammaproteobacteria bacterium]|nr:23S rRNA (pseudouridine(1915)-N(3))-methyltransferase RlmH [Gammaproteobacteria bacterium]MCH9743364.1 23S rRNA (pseudouridine(1915)-N(3))-methyltransferase RlmH [Gammaproteobacteria bacterium]